ncbi:hypothetical protein [Bdellovibrio sp. HCB337]|uniref:hypothetical protein n=1 Tax=Bdellovibrio sp. HCB337 TaxID=3394358 RepID=UPI0039A52C88
MKSIIALLALTAGLSQAHADTMNCTIKEGGAQTRETKVQHVYDPAVAHAFTTFDSAYATGFVAVNRGYGVVNVVSRETQRSSSFYGKIGGGNIIGGTLYIGKDDSSWFNVECQ